MRSKQRVLVARSLAHLPERRPRQLLMIVALIVKCMTWGGGAPTVPSMILKHGIEHVLVAVAHWALSKGMFDGGV